MTAAGTACLIARAQFHGVDVVVDRRPATRERIVVEHDPETGVRLKYYSRAADVQYWTDLWRQNTAISYHRELRGHLPHQLRSTFKRWVRPGSRTLEAGCGLGRFTVAANALGYCAEGLDWSAETIAALRQRFAWIPWHVGDVRSVDFPSGTFDAVYSPGVCEHFEEGPVATLIETRRLLRRGGIAIVSTPCLNVWLQRNSSRLADSRGPTDGEFYQYAFTPEGMAALLTRVGFDVLQVRPYAVLDTFIRYGGWRILAPFRDALALPLDYVPIVRQWGSTCIWVARKC